MTRGVKPDRTEQLRDAFALGGEALCERIPQVAKTSREVVEPPGLRRRVAWPKLARIVETVVGEKADRLLKRRGPAGKPLLL